MPSSMSRHRQQEHRQRRARAPTQKRRVMSTQFGVRRVRRARRSRGSSAMPQIGHAPGPSRTISGCIGHVYSTRVSGGDRTGPARAPCRTSGTRRLVLLDLGIHRADVPRAGRRGAAGCRRRAGGARNDSGAALNRVEAGRDGRSSRSAPVVPAPGRLGRIDRHAADRIEDAGGRARALIGRVPPFGRRVSAVPPGLVATPGEILEDRALRPLIAVAAMDQCLERPLHPLELVDLLFEIADVTLRDSAYITAAAAPVLPQPQQLRDLLHREAEPPRPAHELQGMNVRGVVEAVTGIGTLGRSGSTPVTRSGGSSWATRLTGAPPRRCSGSRPGGRRPSPASFLYGASSSSCHPVSTLPWW